ncbi:MAG: hypothetical protein IPO58_17115 [Betaproteobacteria bacterium]|nr:hypothetical protein [Betaproteobacteria bacterium]MBK9608065.1 hypothetical protein [Betaproteobacteria bacterium]
MNNRRKLIIALGAGVIAAPFRICAQPVKRSVVVGFLAAEGQLSAQSVVAAFKQELQKFGYFEGQNLTLQSRYADGKFDLVPGFVSELVDLKADVIVSAGAVTTRALQKATSTIPIVMANVLDPVGAGLVKTLARPGGNITGLSSLGTDIGAKHLELLLRVVPKLPRVAVMSNAAPAALRQVFGNEAVIDLLISDSRLRPEAEIGRHPPIWQSITGSAAPRRQELARLLPLA